MYMQLVRVQEDKEKRKKAKRVSLELHNNIQVMDFMEIEIFFLLHNVRNRMTIIIIFCLWHSS